MKKPNAAQAILAMCGVPDQTIFLGHYREKNYSHTKKGPGRTHRTGKKDNK